MTRFTIYTYIILFCFIQDSFFSVVNHSDEQNQIILDVFNKIIEEKLHDLFAKYANITNRLNQIETKIDQIQSRQPNIPEFHFNIGIRLKNHYSKIYSAKSVWNCYEICKNDETCSAISYNNYLNNCYFFKQNEYIITNDLDWSSVFKSNHHVKINNKKSIIIENNPIKLKLYGHTEAILSMTILPNGNLVTGSADKSIIVWNANNGSIITKLQGHTDSVSSLAVLKNGDLASGSSDHTIIIWNINNGSIRRKLNSNSQNHLTVLSNGDLVSGSYFDSIKIWDTNNGKIKHTLKCSDSTFSYATTSLTILPDSGDLIGSSCYGNLISWNTNDGTFKQLVNNETFYFDFIKVLPNGDLAIVNKDADNSIIILNKRDYKLKLKLFGHTNYVTSLEVLNNGDLVSSSLDNSIIIWDLKYGFVKKKLLGHDSGVNRLLTLPNGDLASGSDEGPIFIWNRSYFS